MAIITAGFLFDCFFLNVFPDGYIFILAKILSRMPRLRGCVPGMTEREV